MAPGEPSSDGPPLDETRLFETLLEHRVRFVVVGGQAAAYYGALRHTLDADVVVDHSDENLTRLSAALDELSWRYRREGLSDDEATTLSSNIHMSPELLDRLVETLMTDAGPLDVLRVIPTLQGETPGRDYNSLVEEAIPHPVLPGLTVKLAALNHIIESKQWADRPKDREALPELIDLQEQQRQAGRC